MRCLPGAGGRSFPTGHLRHMGAFCEWMRRRAYPLGQFPERGPANKKMQECFGHQAQSRIPDKAHSLLIRIQSHFPAIAPAECK